MPSNPCAKCKAKPAYWHSPTLSYLCSTCTAAYRRRFHVELAQGLRDDAPPMTWRDKAVLAVLAVLSAALVWAVLVVALGLAS